MKFTIRQLIALMIVLAIGIQTYQASRDRRQLAGLESVLSRESQQNRALGNRTAYRHRQSAVCEAVVKGYDYPTDFLAAKRRFERLRSREADRERSHQ